MGKRGPAPWQPTDEERRLVEHYVSLGYTQEQIGSLMDKSTDSLQRYCRRELDNGSLSVNAKIGGKLFQKAMGGDTSALIFWCKTRMGWKEIDRHELTGANGGPIQHEQAQADADQFTRRIAGLAARSSAPSGDGQTKH